MVESQFVQVPPFEWLVLEDTGLEVKWEGVHDGRVRIQQDETEERPVVILFPADSGGWRIRQAEY